MRAMVNGHLGAVFGMQLVDSLGPEADAPTSIAPVSFQYLVHMIVTIRVAAEEDIPEIFQIRTSVRENHISVEKMAEMGITRQTIGQALRNEPCIWVAEHDGYIVGFSMADAASACVFALFIRPDWEGHGIGSLLIERAEAFLFERHTSIWLGTDASSRAAGFYERRGWKRMQIMDSGDTRFEKLRS